MKKKNLLLVFVVLFTMATAAYAQLTNGAQYRVFCEADPTHGVYFENNAEPFLWGNSEKPGVFMTINHNAEWASDVWQFEYTAGKYIRTAGGGLTLCATSTNQAGESSNTWKLVPDGDPVDGIQYYLIPNASRSSRYMYFNPTPDNNVLKLYTNEAARPTDETRKYWRIGFEKNAAPVLLVSESSLPFSTSFLSKDFTVTCENATSDIVFTVPEGITLSGTNVVDNSGSYSIAAANANGENTVTITANSDEGIDGSLIVSVEGATDRSIELKSGVKEGAWYNIKLFHFTENLNLAAKGETPKTPTLKVPDAANFDQLFTFIPVTGKNETFKIKNANGEYLLGASTGVVSYGSSTGTTDEEWTLDKQNGNPSADYFSAFTLKVGSVATDPYLGHVSTAVDVDMTATYPINTKGTYKLIAATNPTTSVDNVNEKIVVYTNSNRQVVISGTTATMVTVYNVTGQKIAEKAIKNSDTFVDIPNTGVYILNISGNGINKAFKIILK